jgi:A/G-specific adenine glycosylase
MAWWRAASRDLPWRRSLDPYRVWVSEVMLQQTRVAAAIPYFRRFTARFPTVRALARARRQAVLKVWQGLGYYARARNLHEAARRVAARGRFPRSAAEWRDLPGVGEYTAAAVASIVSGERAAVFDGNVRRVLGRLLGGGKDRRLRAAAQASIPARDPGGFNQALMELGQVVCRPVDPACPMCPLRRECRWVRGERVPAPKRRAARPHKEIGVGVVWRDGKVLIGRRPESSMLGGLWEFPGGKRRRGESIERTVEREVLEETGVRVRVTAPLATVRHAYSHFEVTLRVLECRFAGGRARPIGCEEVRWVRPGMLERLPFPSANVRIIEAIRRGR